MFFLNFAVQILKVCICRRVRRRWFGFSIAIFDVKDLNRCHWKQKEVHNAMSSSLTPCAHLYHSLSEVNSIEDFWHNITTLAPQLFPLLCSQFGVDLEFQEPRQGQEPRSPDNTKSNLTAKGRRRTLSIQFNKSIPHCLYSTPPSPSGLCRVIIPNGNERTPLRSILGAPTYAHTIH